MFSKLQSVKATANSVNNSFREFREYVEDIKVSYLHEDIRETASEVKHKILIELEKRFFNVDTGHLVAYEVFRKYFYNKLKISEFNLKEYFCNISIIYPSIDICKLRPQFVSLEPC